MQPRTFFTLVAIGGFFAAMCIGIAWIVKLRVAARRRWQAWKRREPSDDVQFLQHCQLEASSEAARVALALRHVLADERGVPAESIRAHDALDDRFWDSLDMIDVAIRLEKATGLRPLRGSFVDDAQQLAGGAGGILRVEHLAQALVKVSGV